VEDLEATNGTMIGRAQLRLYPLKMYELTHNKHITFGPVKCLFKLLDPKKVQSDTDSVDSDLSELVEQVCDSP
jgi:hypothetical protein